MTLSKLAYLTGEYPRASDTFIQREVAALRALGHTVETCSIRTTGAEHLVGPEQRSEHGRTFKVLDACRNPLRLLRAHARWLRDPRRYGSALKLAWQTAPKGIKGRAYNLIYFAEAAVLADHLTEQGVTHLHNHIAKASCTVAMLASALSGIPFSFTIHGPDIFFEPHHWRIDEKAARATFVACISEFCRSQLMCFADQRHWAKLHIIHCGVDPDRYSLSPHNGQNLLFVGRLAAVKGVPLLLEAVKRLAPDHPDMTLTLVGDGPDRAALEQQVRALDLDERVTFLGYRSQSEVADLLAQADLFTLPSFAEGVPVVLMEAMAAGVPVVTTQIAGISELVTQAGLAQHVTKAGQGNQLPQPGLDSWVPQPGPDGWVPQPGHGRLVPPGDVDALSREIASLLSSADTRRKMGLTARAQVEQAFNIGTEAARLSHLFTAYAQGVQPPKRPEVPE